MQSHDPNHKRGKIKGELLPVKRYFKPPFTIAFIERLRLEAWFDRWYGEFAEAILRAKEERNQRSKWTS